MTFPKFLVLPVAAWDTIKDREQALHLAQTNAEKFHESFVVVEAKYVGMYETSRPVWNDLDPEEAKAEGELNIRRPLK